LEKELWSRVVEVVDELRLSSTPRSEREAADFIADHFKGFGPKQSRNLLQSLGLTRYEIPIDSRITKWLNDFGFPVRLSAGALADRNYYDFVSEGFQQLAAQSEIYPCVLDAAIFASFDRGGWSEGNVIW
jgi:thermostable 8-oxoguanine DNA glycosylase